MKMNMKMLPLESVLQKGVATPVGTENNNLDAGFGDILKKSIDSVTSRIQEADKLSQGLASGQHGNIHETMIAIEKAGISFRLMTKMQQKAIQAYQDIMRIQL